MLMRMCVVDDDEVFREYIYMIKTRNIYIIRTVAIFSVCVANSPINPTPPLARSSK